MTDAEPRDKLAAAIRSAQIRDVPVAITGSAVESIVDSILAQCHGLMIWRGQVRQIKIADRFGPASWEITTHELSGDSESWDDPEVEARG